MPDSLWSTTSRLDERARRDKTRRQRRTYRRNRRRDWSERPVRTFFARLAGR